MRVDLTSHSHVTLLETLRRTTVTLLIIFSLLISPFFSLIFHGRGFRAQWMPHIDTAWVLKPMQRELKAEVPPFPDLSPYDLEFPINTVPWDFLVNYDLRTSLSSLKTWFCWRISPFLLTESSALLFLPSLPPFFFWTNGSAGTSFGPPTKSWPISLWGLGTPFIDSQFACPTVPLRSSLGQCLLQKKCL